MPSTSWQLSPTTAAWLPQLSEQGNVSSSDVTEPEASFIAAALVTEACDTLTEEPFKPNSRQLRGGSRGTASRLRSGPPQLTEAP